MKKFAKVVLCLATILMTVSCDYFYSLDILNEYEKGIYIWSQATGLKTGNDPKSLDELNDSWYLNHADKGKMASIADILTQRKMSARDVVNYVFKEHDTLFVAIFDAEEMDSNWGKGKMSDYVIQRYWLSVDDVVEPDGVTYKTISFPPNEGMKKVRMVPAYGTYNKK